MPRFRGGSSPAGDASHVHDQTCVPNSANIDHHWSTGDRLPCKEAYFNARQRIALRDETDMAGQDLPGHIGPYADACRLLRSDDPRLVAWTLMRGYPSAQA